MPEIKAWQITTNEELERLFAIRMTVFVEEQKVDPNNEIDAADFAETTLHVLATVDGKDAGTARLLIDGPGRARVGRMAVHELAREHAGGTVRLELSAQESALGFYERLGYEITSGERYLDENIWHQDMHVILRRADDA